jgi:hypothetical protein
MVASCLSFSQAWFMRRERNSILVVLLCACAPEQTEKDEPIGERFWLAAGGWEWHPVEMYRADDQIELQTDYVRRAIGTLTDEGLTAWDEAVASIDPAVVPDLHRCAPADGVDICVDVEHESGPLEVCYCAHNPPAEVAELDAFFTGLVEALNQCESSSHLVIDLCEVN